MKRIHLSAAKRELSIGVRCLLLLLVCSVILFPLLMLISTSGKDLFALVDPQVYWLPTQFHFSNFARAFQIIGGPATFLRGFLLIGVAAAGQVIISMITAYGFAKYHFFGKKALFLAMVATFFIPREITFLSQYILHSNYGLLGTIWTMLLPVFLGQGTKNTLIVLLFYQFMRSSPKALEEAAMIDGASLPQIMFRIGIPLAAPATIITSVLAFAWNWNDTYFAKTFFQGKIVTPALALQNIRSLYTDMYSGTMENANALFHNGIEAAAGLLVILPILILYLVLQKRLVASVDRVGITGE